MATYLCKSLSHSHSSFTLFTFPSSSFSLFSFNSNFTCYARPSPSISISLRTYSNHNHNHETLDFGNTHQNVGERVNTHASSETLQHSRLKDGFTKINEIQKLKLTQKVNTLGEVNQKANHIFDLTNNNEKVYKRGKVYTKWVKSGETIDSRKVNYHVAAFFTDEALDFTNDGEFHKEKIGKWVKNDVNKVKCGQSFNLGQRIVDIVRNDSHHSSFGRSLVYSNAEISKIKVGNTRNRVLDDSKWVKNGKKLNLGKGNGERLGFDDREPKRENNNEDNGWSRERGSKNYGKNGGRNDFWKRSEMGDGVSSLKSSGSKENRDRNGDRVSVVSKNCKSDYHSKEKRRMSKDKKADSPGFQLRIGLDMCSKKGDVMRAISLYDSAVKKGVTMAQYQYTVMLYLCASASMGVIRPAKSGSGSRTMDKVSSHDSEKEEEDDDSGEKLRVNEIWVSDDVKKYALKKGLEVYERMCSEKIQMNEATLTSVARMAMAMGDGDMAFNMVKEMKSMGISPKLRSYSPALSVFSSSGELEKAFDVEKHMLENGVYPEEPELQALLRVSIQSNKADKVYYVLHKLRSNVRSVSPSTAELIEKWFRSRYASRVGKRKWDAELLARTMENVGGGWHGLGWLGSGKWTVSRTTIGSDALCKCCGEKLTLIDLDPVETDKFAESVASIAIKKDKNNAFQKFQGWLDYYGPFEAVVDAANVGLFNQRKFKPSKVNAVVNGIRQVLPSKKWPLIVLHNRRVTGGKMGEPMNKAVIDRWINADALYATPTGSNDDWYWLYAAIKFKCLLVTNDEMRDHTFQLLGNDFFPKWKERHQVRFSFSEIGPVFHMPPPCSVVIQESVRGCWHVPIASEQQFEGDRIWLCISRLKLLVIQKDSEEVNLGA